jgi:serine/threonine-protein kinase
VREIDRLEPRLLTDIDGAQTAAPFFSPDGQWVGFVKERGVWKVPIGGGPSVLVTDVPANTGASWDADDHLILAPTSRAPLSRVPASGGEPQDVTTLDAARGEASHRWPEVLPGGRAIIFTAGPPAEGPWHDAQIVAQSLDTGERHLLVRGAQAHYVTTGHLTYTYAGTLYAVAFDPTTLRTSGSPVAMVDDVYEHPSHGASQFVVSGNGTLAYISGGLASTELVWVSRQGTATLLMPKERRFFEEPRLSPDGRRVALRVGGGNDSTYVYDIDAGQLSRVTSGGNRLSPTWSADGMHVTTSTTVDRAFRALVWSSVDRSGPEQVLYTDPEMGVNPGSWSPDGRVLAFTRDRDIWTLTMPDRRAAPWLRSPYVEAAPVISPDGRWLAYSSNESGRHEIYVQPFPDGGRRWLVSRAGGTEPVWSRTSPELFFRQNDAVVAVAGRPPFQGAVTRFDAPWARSNAYTRATYDVAPDGQGFLMIRRVDPDARIHVILNWSDELKRRVSSAR